MHIVIATPAFPPFVGGGERHTGTLAHNLVARGHSVTVVTSAAEREQDLWQGRGRQVTFEEVRPGLIVIRTPLQPVRGGYRGLLAWRKSMVLLSSLPGTGSTLQAMATLVPPMTAVDEALSLIPEPVDVVHGFNISWEHAMMAGREYAFRGQLPFVASPLAHLGSGRRDRVALNSTMRHQIQLLSSADMLLTNTADEAARLQARGVNVPRIGVAGPGVDVPDVVADLPGPARDWQPYLLFVGRLSQDKGAIHAAQAVLHLRSQGSPVQLVLIGRETDEFSNYYNGLSRAEQEGLHILGFVEESLKHAYLRDAAALVLPSRSDSFGIVLLESWLYGCPVIAASSGGIPSVVDDGENGYLVPYGDVLALSAAIRVVTEDQELNHTLGEAGRRKLHANYTWDIITEKVLAAYQTVARARESDAHAA